VRYGQNKFLQPFCFLFQRFLVSNATWETADVKNVFSSPKIGGVAQNSCQNGQMDGEIWQKQAIGDGRTDGHADTHAPKWSCEGVPNSNLARESVASWIQIGQWMARVGYVII